MRPPPAPTPAKEKEKEKAPFALTSSAFVEGSALPARFSCTGADVSPPLSWTTVAGAASYAVVLTDLTINFAHSAIWDIPAAVRALPEGIPVGANVTDPAGAKQAASWNRVVGWAGPCPQSQHTYELKLFAVDQASLAGVNAGDDRVAVIAALQAAAIQTTTLTVTFTP